MLLFLFVFKGIAFLDHVEVCYAPVMGPVDLLAPADNVCGRELGALRTGFKPVQFQHIWSLDFSGIIMFSRNSSGVNSAI